AKAQVKHGLAGCACLVRCGQSSRAEFAEAREKLMRACDILADLRFQFGRPGKFLFFAQPFPEANFNASCFELCGRVQKLRFNGQRISDEGGPCSDVGYRAAALCFAVEESASDVNAAGREQFLLRYKIQRRDCETMADARAGDNFSGQHEWPAEQAGRV